MKNTIAGLCGKKRQVFQWRKFGIEDGPILTTLLLSLQHGGAQDYQAADGR